MLKDKYAFLEHIESVLNAHHKEIPSQEYVKLFQEYKNLCISYTKLLKKEKERNYKFINVKKTLIEEHEKITHDLHIELDEYKRLSKECLKNKKKHSDNIINVKQNIDLIIKKYFGDENIKKILKTIIEQLTKKDAPLDFSKIDLQFFEFNKINLLQRAIYKVVKETINSNTTAVISAVTNTILRENYKFIHYRFAKKVLKAANISRGVFKFFGENFVEDDENTRWSSYAITRFMNDYFEQIKKLKNLDKELVLHKKILHNLKEELDELDSSQFNQAESIKTEIRKHEKIVHDYLMELGESEIIFSELKLKYQKLLEAVTITLIQKRKLFIKDHQEKKETK
jgi:uncharacterized protein YejL (UPF0352 family)